MKKTAFFKLAVSLALCASTARAAEWVDQSPVLQLFATSQKLVREHRLQELDPQIAKLQTLIQTYQANPNHLPAEAVAKILHGFQVTLDKATALKASIAAKKFTFEIVPSNETWAGWMLAVQAFMTDVASFEAIQSGDSDRYAILANWRLVAYRIQASNRLENDSYDRQTEDIAIAINMKTDDLKKYYALLTNPHVKLAFLGSGQNKITETTSDGPSPMDAIFKMTATAETARLQLQDQVKIDEAALKEYARLNVQYPGTFADTIKQTQDKIAAENITIAEYKVFQTNVLIRLAQFAELSASQVFFESRKILTDMSAIGLVVQTENTDHSQMPLLTAMNTAPRASFLGILFNAAVTATKTFDSFNLAPFQAYVETYIQLVWELTSSNTSQTRAAEIIRTINTYSYEAPATQPSPPAGK